MKNFDLCHAEFISASHYLKGIPTFVGMTNVYVFYLSADFCSSRYTGGAEFVKFNSAASEAA